MRVRSVGGGIIGGIESLLALGVGSGPGASIIFRGGGCLTMVGVLRRGANGEEDREEFGGLAGGSEDVGAVAGADD